MLMLFLSDVASCELCCCDLNTWHCVSNITGCLFNVVDLVEDRRIWVADVKQRVDIWNYGTLDRQRGSKVRLGGKQSLVAVTCGPSWCYSEWDRIKVAVQCLVV